MLLSKMADVYPRCILGEASVLFSRQKAVCELNERIWHETRQTRYCGYISLF